MHRFLLAKPQLWIWAVWLFEWVNERRVIRLLPTRSGRLNFLDGAMIMASYRAAPKMVRFLLDAGADPSAKGYLAFIAAASNNNAALMERLIEMALPTKDAIDAAMEYALHHANNQTQGVVGRLRSSCESAEIASHVAPANSPNRQIRL